MKYKVYGVAFGFCLVWSFGCEASVLAVSSSQSSATRRTLHDAARIGDVETVTRLIADGANLDEKYHGKTPLHYAAKRGHAGVVKLLLEKGAKLDEKDNLGETPLHKAAGRGHAEVVKLLLTGGAKLNEKNNQGGAPLHLAASGGRAKVVRVLCEKGAKLDEKDDDDRTPLHYAACAGKVGVTGLLLDKGAKPGVKSKNGWTPLDCAVHRGHKAIVKLLLLREALEKVLVLGESVQMLFAVMYCHLRKLPAPQDVSALRTAAHRLPEDLLKLILGFCTDTRYAILAGKVFYGEFERSLGDCVYRNDQELQAIERRQTEEGKCSAEIIEVTMKEAYAELTKLNREKSSERYKLLIKRLFNGQVRTACLQLIKDRTTGQEIYYVDADAAPMYVEKVKHAIDTLCAASPGHVKDQLLRIKPSDDEVAVSMKKLFNEHLRCEDASGILRMV